MTVLVFATGALLPVLLFACIMATISVLGERHRSGYGQELHDWWRSRPWLIDATFFIVSCLSGLLFALPASAHSWYEFACCTDKDCKPVSDEDVVELKEGVQVRKWGLLSYSDPRLRWSHDGRVHICESPTKLHCVYRPPPAT